MEGGLQNADIEPCAKIEKDTKDVKALVMHSVYVWGCENVPMAGRERAWPESDNTEITQVPPSCSGVGTGHCQDFIIKHEE